ncbi:NAD(P)/FAD-dependent oxidoreductase [Paenibacillus beijingensis]|uniref:Pyridine nucleotide-disulfide oxidoreductase n=1 Tax=Paenibacillus beijingensis TaxID=1126833 RepID=A0A0D5NJQ5_9BACL|nr:NAD(P)/FAD-dependent oxidoreductase [Paenibacillus beijingensis]AJY75501.1 pyridine nucleotide-disulfide oxidoreductase [Paenibacillus beijingensis]
MLQDCVIVGGGIAGLQAAIQLGRYNHRVLVLDSGDGRSSYCLQYHNLLGWPDGISGPELRQHGRIHAERLGVTFVSGRAVGAKQTDEGFAVETESGETVRAKRLLLATGVMDRLPELKGELTPCLGISIYVCPDCDGYELTGKRALVIGSGNVGARMALTLLYWTRNLVYINHEQTGVDKELIAQMEKSGVEYVNEAVRELKRDGSFLTGVVTASGRTLKAERGFVAFGGNEVRSNLAQQLGVRLHANRHVLADPRTKMTNVMNVWAAGDVLAHSEQTAIAMGDGSQAAIWIHKSLIEPQGSQALAPLVAASGPET